jgi:hypothetical protein
LEFLKGYHGIQLIELPGHSLPQNPRASSPGGFRVMAIKDVRSTLIFERPDHKYIISGISCYVKKGFGVTH